MSIRGELLKSYFLVTQERRGEKGYLVFGGLMTGIIDPNKLATDDDENFY